MGPVLTTTTKTGKFGLGGLKYGKGNKRPYEESETKLLIFFLWSFQLNSISKSLKMTPLMTSIQSNSSILTANIHSGINYGLQK